MLDCNYFEERAAKFEYEKHDRNIIVPIKNLLFSLYCNKKVILYHRKCIETHFTIEL